MLSACLRVQWFHSDTLSWCITGDQLGVIMIWDTLTFNHHATVAAAGDTTKGWGSARASGRASGRSSARRGANAEAGAGTEGDDESHPRRRENQGGHSTGISALCCVHYLSAGTHSAPRDLIFSADDSGHLKVHTIHTRRCALLPAP